MLNPPNYPIWSPYVILKYIMQNFKNKYGGTIDKYAEIGFNRWTLRSHQDYISFQDWVKYFHMRPLDLSVEQVVICCATRGAGSCITHPPKEAEIPNLRPNNQACKGNTLNDAWYQLYTAGTVSSDCMKYSLQDYKKQKIPSCLELQGPGYSYCSGALPMGHWSQKELDQQLINSAKSNTLPFTTEIAQAWNNGKIDPKITSIHKPQWTTPILFIFKAKEPYTVKAQKDKKTGLTLNNEEVIKRELYENGPVTTALTVYYDFEEEFGNPQGNAGGRDWKEGDKLSNLIYTPQPNQDVIGGHAVLITGWGTYKKKHPYWIIQNSWGIKWGHGGFPKKDAKYGPPWQRFFKTKKGKEKGIGEGYFWIKRGGDTCGVESRVVVAKANIDNIIYDPKPNKTIPTTKYNEYGKFMYEPKPLEAGGQWNYPFGVLSQYDPPSAFTLKWPDNKKRPIFTLGTLSSKMSAKDITIDLDSPKLQELLKYRVNYPTYTGVGSLAEKHNKKPPKSAPIVLIDDEFVQVYDYDGGKFKILRGVWSSTPQSHVKGSKVQIFPYQSLNASKIM